MALALMRDLFGLNTGKDVGQSLLPQRAERPELFWGPSLVVRIRPDLVHPSCYRLGNSGRVSAWFRIAVQEVTFCAGRGGRFAQQLAQKPLGLFPPFAPGRFFGEPTTAT